MIVRQDRQTRRPPLAGGWSVRGADPSTGLGREDVPGAGMDVIKVPTMTQEEKWIARYEEVVAFIGTNHRNPSKHRIEEHDMLNRVKQIEKR